MSYFSTYIGERLRAEVAKQCLSGKEIAAGLRKVSNGKISLSTRQANRIIHDGRMNSDQLFCLCKFMGISTEDLNPFEAKHATMSRDQSFRSSRRKMK